MEAPLILREAEEALVLLVCLALPEFLRVVELDFVLLLQGQEFFTQVAEVVL
jgi:hypothetical protein